MALSPGLLFLSGWEQILQDSSLSLTCTSNYLPAWSHFTVFLWPHCLHVGHHLKVSTWLPGCTSSFPARALDNLPSLVTQFSLCYQINSPETEVPKAESIAQIKQWPSVHEVPGSAPSTAKKKKKWSWNRSYKECPRKTRATNATSHVFILSFWQTKYPEKACTKHLLHFDPEIIPVKPWPWSRLLLSLDPAVDTC